MESHEFARLLVTELVDNAPSRADFRLLHQRMNIGNLEDANEIWKAFARYNLETGGVKSEIVDDRWNRISANSMLKNRQRLLAAIVRLKGENAACYRNVTTCCPVTFKGDRGFGGDCLCKRFFENCPVVAITRDISWHRLHYKVAKIIVECAKKMLIEDIEGKKDGSINDFASAVFNKHRGSGDDWKSKATCELISRFADINGYGNPPKVIVYMLSALSSPVHKVNHWPDVDLTQLKPIDTHVSRLVVRFGFVKPGQSSKTDILRRLSELYPEEPRKLDFALFRLGSDVEEGICTIKPNCSLCARRYPRIFSFCPSIEKNRPDQ
jgi:hypothetical protein